MKRFILSIISIAAVITLGTMQSRLITAYAASIYNSSKTVSKSVVPKVVIVKINGTATLWSDAIGFSSPKVDPIHTSAKFVPDLTKGVWDITVTNLSFPWNASTILTLQDGKVASGIFRPSTNAASLTVPLQHVPLIDTIQINLSTEGSITTTTRQIIRGSRVDRKGRVTLIGSVSHIGLFDNQAQVRMQGTLSPWPLPPLKVKRSVKGKK
jgi:hypothetical protein